MKKPSITELLDILAKPALIGWANKLGLKGIEVNGYMKGKRNRGTSMHSQIEHACFDEEKDAERYMDFMHDKQVIFTEQNIETDWFVGRYDAMMLISGEKYVVDYKKGYKGKIYLENKLQLIAYTMAVPAKMAVIGVPLFTVHEFEPADRKPYEEIIKRLSEIYQFKQEISKNT